MTIYSAGYVTRGFESIAEVFEEIISSERNSGAALLMLVERKLVVDLWGGLGDAGKNSDWQERTLNVIFSSTKGLVSILAAQLVQAGVLDYEALVSDYWPEFAQSGKAKVKLKHLLSHRTGLAVLKDDICFEDVLDWQKIVGKLEIQEPMWIPGEEYAYHAITFGWLVGEVIRRVTGMSIGQYFEKAVSELLQADTWIGLPLSQELRVANLHAALDLESFFLNLEQDSSTDGDLLIKSLTLGNAFPPTLITPDGGFNDWRAHAAEIPGAGGISTARGLATIWSAVVTETKGVRLLSDSTIKIGTQVQSEGKPFFGGNPPYGRFGMGFQLSSPAQNYLGLSSFGHDGAGGQCAFADIEHRVGFAFLTNRMRGPSDDRATRLIKALKDLL